MENNPKLISHQVREDAHDENRLQADDRENLIGLMERVADAHHAIETAIHNLDLAIDRIRRAVSKEGLDLATIPLRIIGPWGRDYYLIGGNQVAWEHHRKAVIA